MAIYLVSWDVHKQKSGDYAELYAWLTQRNETRFLESVSIIEAPPEQAEDLIAELRDTVKESDGLLVIEVTSNAGFYNLGHDGKKLSELAVQAALRGARVAVPI